MAIGGMVVSPGDIVVGEVDGLVAFPVEGASDLLRACADRQVVGHDIPARIRAGAPAGYGG